MKVSILAEGRFGGRFFRKLPKFSSLTLQECYKIQFMGDLEQMEELCELDTESDGCEHVCAERVRQVFGETNDIFDMWYYHIRRPECEPLCQGTLSMDDLTIDELQDVKHYNETGSVVRSASYD